LIIMKRSSTHENFAKPVRIAAGPITLEGDLVVPAGARGIVVFAHGSGSGRHSPRNRFVAEALQSGGLATLLFDLLTEDEKYQERSHATCGSTSVFWLAGSSRPPTGWASRPRLAT
jgi:hypothetical protein